MRGYETVVGRLPAPLAARLDSCRPALLSPWGGPFNGQLARSRIVEGIASAVSFDLVLETGTYRGTTTEHLAERFPDLPVRTAEHGLRYFLYARRRLDHHKNVLVHRGDSRRFLQQMWEQFPTARPFIYLDAHWEQDLPLADELRIITTSWASAVVMIDDFEVPGDHGYGFDDYGPGRALNASILQPALASLDLYYPTASSDQETGARRGCCVLGTKDLAPDLNRLVSLRPADRPDR